MEINGVTIRPELFDFISELEKLLQKMDLATEKKNSWRGGTSEEHIESLFEAVDNYDLRDHIESGEIKLAIDEAVLISFLAFAAVDCYIN